MIMRHLTNISTDFVQKLLLGAALLCGSVCNAQEWIDVTETYVNNPNYDGNNLGGWSGTSLGAYNPRENAEHYEKNYDTYQTLTGLQAGTYRVSLNAFYRMGSSGNDYSLYSSGNYQSSQYAQLYATSSEGDFYTLIAPASSAALSSSLGGATSQVGDWNRRYYIPNNMEAAYYWFGAGYYQNSVECQVGSDGVLTIGIRKSTTLSGDWTCIDNWKLEFWGELVEVEGIVLSDSNLELVMGETFQLTATVLPEDATYQKVMWTSKNESVATVDANGLITAVSKGSTVITAYDYEWNALAYCQVEVIRNDPSSANVIINEIMPSNVDVYLDPSQNYGSWVELYNPTDRGVTLGGLYITDDPANLKKHRLIDTYGAIPAQGYALLNFDHYEPFTQASYRQIDDKLNAEGGTIIISDGTTVIAQQTYPQMPGRISYARTKDGGATWGMTGTPTPGASNIASSFATVQLAAPVVDLPAQLFSNKIYVNVTIPTGATLRYTTDGTAPTLTNGSRSASGVFSTEETTCYRFRLFQDGMLPSPVVTRTYIKDNGNEPFPIISVVTDPANIYSEERGVFSQGPNGRPGNGQTSNCNWNMGWDRPVNFEYITTEGECVVSQECDLSVCGGWSRAWSPRSFKLKASKQYDLQNFFSYQFFEGKPFLKHKTLQIRNGGNDTGPRIKDGAVQGIVETSGMNVDYQSWQPVHVYINGNSYAVLNMREPNNKHFAYANYGIDTDLMDQFEMSPDSGYVQMAGTEESFLHLVELSVNATDAATYAEIGQLIDVDEYINYMAIQLYVGNWDWPQNNVKGFRSQQDGKFRFVLFDMDGSLSTDTPFNTFFGKQNYNFDTLHGYDYSQNRSIEGEHRYLEIKFVTLFNNLLKNETFKKKFFDAFCLVAGSVFTPEQVNQVVNERANYLSSGNYVNPWNTANSLINGFSGRQSTMINHLQSYFGLSGSQKLTATLSSNVDEAQLLLNGQEVPTGKFSGSLFAPVTLKAVAPAGYKFVGWLNESDVTTTTKEIFSEGSNWSYYDQGSLDNTNWKTSSYSTNSWASGQTPIGYDYNSQHPEIVTETAGNLPTYYFRKSFYINTPVSDADFALNWIADDGFIVYVNGKEAGRYQMSSGEATYSQYATTWAHNNPDTGTMTLDASLFKQGTNLIAVELHNNSGTSTDILWNASLSMLTYEMQDATYVATTPEYTLPTSGTVTLKAVWEPLPADLQIAQGVTPLKVNELSAANDIYVNDLFKRDDWVELYNTTGDAVDLAGMYLSDDTDTPQKFQISESDDVNTVIEPKGHIVVWASKRNGLSQLHAPFKLGMGSGEAVLLTSEDGTWADTLIYTWHEGCQSVGLYPDGSQSVYVMDLPSIGKKNTCNSYAQLIATKPYNTGQPLATFTLNLSEGWNWISHPLQNALPLSAINVNAERFVSQTQQSIYDTKLGWTGSLTSLSPAVGYKVKMQSDMSYTYGAPFYNAATNAITLKSGWNWIGYPLLSSQTVSTALEGLTAAEGDIIVGQNGIATYEGGAWGGSLQMLQPGAAYLYKSVEAKAFRYHELTAAEGAKRAKAQFFTQPRSPWTVDMGAYPDVMNIIAKVTADGTETTDYSIGAFTEDGECRGIGQYVGDILYLTVYGEGLENIYLKAANPQTGLVSDVNETFFFNANVVGNRTRPVTLTVGNASGITSVKYASALADATYYTLDGLAVGSSKAALRTGVYIAKYRLTDGTTFTKKLVIK